MWEQLKRVIKPNGAIVLFGAEPFSSVLRMSNTKQFKYDWVWDKVSAVGFANAKKMPLRNIENISVFYSSLPIYNPQGLKKLATSKTVNNSATHKSKTERGESALNGGRFKESYTQEYTNYPKQILTFARTRGLHPTQKPVELMEYLIKTYTNEDETVLDFTAGSFTTGVACINTNRKFIGIELDKNYFNIGVNRIKERIKCLDLKIELDIRTED